MKIAYTKTGEIQGVFSDNVLQAHVGTELLSVSGLDMKNLDLYFVNTNSIPATLSARSTLYIDIVPSQSIHSGASVSLNGIPVGATVECEGENYTVTDGSFEATFENAGDYVVTVTHPHYLPWSQTIMVTNESSN